MLIQINNSMGSKSKVKEMREKFERSGQNTDNSTNKQQSPPVPLPRLKNKFQINESDENITRQLQLPKRTVITSLSYQPESSNVKPTKLCKLRRNLPVTIRKTQLSPILGKTRPDKMQNSIALDPKNQVSTSESEEKMEDSIQTTSSVMENDSNNKPTVARRQIHTLSVSNMVEALEEISKNTTQTTIPPAKPPRTFAHDHYIAQKAAKVKIQEHIYESVENMKLNGTSKTSKNEKSENQNGGILKNANSTNYSNSKVTFKNLKSRLQPYAVTDLYNENKGRKLLFPPVPKRRSRFFVDDKPKEGKLMRCLSDEHVYDEPYVEGSLKSYNSDETLVMSNIIYDRINCENIGNNKDDGLHYSSTPILNLRRSFSTKSNRSKAFKKNQIKSQKSAREIVSRTFSSVRRRQCSDESGAVRKSSSDDDSGDSDTELSSKELEKRIIYMRTVSRASSVKLDRPHLSDPGVGKLFDCVLVINLRDSQSNNGYDPYVKLSYPIEYSGSDPVACPALHFCFPDSEFWKPSLTGETYTFVLTNQRGDRTYGYCRRIKPNDAPVSLPVVYCILSPVLSFKFYSRILHELECRHGSPDAEIKSFLDTLHHCRMPRPGHSIRMVSIESNCKEEIFRPIDVTSDDIGIEYLLKTLDVNNIVKIFASLLLERRIVLYSSSLTLLSRCVHSFVAFLHPFVWQHTFIPVLPSIAIDVIGSPTPFLVGILSHFVSKLRDLPLDMGEPVLMVDLDHNRLFHETGDENKVIPKKIQKGLTLALKMAKMGPESSLLATEAFIRLFVETVGHYDNFVVVQQDGKKVFERDSFLTAIESHSIGTFLQWFTETQMFNSFIDSLTEVNPVSYSCFDKRIQEFREELLNEPQTLGKNFKDLGKKVKTLGERLIGLKTVDKKTNN